MQDVAWRGTMPEVKLEKWMEDAGEDCCTGCRKQLPKSGAAHLWPDSHYTPCIRDLTAAIIARHFAARERDVKKLVKAASEVCKWEGRGGWFEKDSARLRAALAPFTAPAASRT